MINGKTVEEYNAMQRQRGYIVSRLHGYEAMEEGDTEESLKADYLELTGEVYRTREEEAADLVVAVEVRGKERKAAQERIDRTQIAIAKDKGFRDCNEVFDFLGFLRLTPAASGVPSCKLLTGMFVDAGFELTVIVEDGYTDVPKAERWGCWAGELVEVINYKAAVDAQANHNEWKRAHVAALAMREFYYNTDVPRSQWTQSYESIYAPLPPEPPQPDIDPDAVKAAGEERREAEKNDALAAAIQSYAGEFNKFDLPRFRQFQEHIWKEAGVRIKRRQIAGLWGKR